MLRTSLRNVFAHKLRLLMTCLAIVFGVAFVSGVMIFSDTVGKGLTGQAGKQYKDLSVRLSTTAAADRSGQLGDFNTALVEKIRTQPGVASVRGNVTGFAGVVDTKSEIIDRDGSTRGTNFSPGPDGKDPIFTITEGTAPAAAGQIALDAKTAKKAGYKPGDTIRLVTNGPVTEQTLTGVFTTDNGILKDKGTVTLFDTATAQQLYAKPGVFSNIDVVAADGTSQQQLAQELKALAPDDTRVETRDKLTKSEKDSAESASSGLRTALLAFAAIALFVGCFIIANTFTMLVAQRTRELALLRAIGATRRQVTRSVRFEALIIGLVSAVIGLVAGIGLAAAMKAIIGGTSDNLPMGSLTISLGTVVTALVVGIGVTVLAAWLPARKAAKVPPIAALRSASEAPSQASLAKRGIIGAVVLLLGIALALVVIKSGGGSQGKVLGVVGCAIIVMIGLIILTPLIAIPAVKVLGGALQSVYKLDGRLAKENALRNPRRTAATASALTIGLILISAMAVFGSSLKAQFNNLVDDSLAADYAISSISNEELDPEIFRQAASAKDVIASSPNAIADLKVGDTRYGVEAMNSVAANQLFKIPMKTGSAEGLSTGLLVAEDEAKREKWTVGSRIPVVFPDGAEAELPVNGVFKVSNLFASTFITSTEIIAPHTDRLQSTQVYVKAAPGKAAAVRDELKKAFGGNPLLKIQSKDDIRKEIGSMVNIMLTVLYAMLGIAVLIAVLGIVNTLAMSVFERIREIGMMRAIGMDRTRVRRMIRLEAVMIAVFGALLGIVVGTLGGYLAIGSIDMAGLKAVIPWGQLALFVLLAAVVGVLAALWPARSAARVNVLEAIKSE